jgi:LCP family protein required for cell wall assembly
VIPRINVLILGVDAGVGRRTFLTDTMIVASLDPVAGTVSLLSFPRDLVDVPLPGGGVYSGKLNALLSYARRHPAEFPGSSGDGHDVLMAAIGQMTGLQVDYYAQVNLAGFVAVVDTLGGIEVNVARAFCDPGYDEYGFTRGFAITAGRHRLSGYQALAYARVRKAAGESDLTRQTRQQEILSGIRDRLVGGGFLGDPVGFLRAMSRTVETNMPRSLVATLVDHARKVDRSRTYRAIIVGRGVIWSGYDARGYILQADFAAVRAGPTLFPPPDAPGHGFPYRSPSPAARRERRLGCAPATPENGDPKPTATRSRRRRLRDTRRPERRPR